MSVPPQTGLPAVNNSSSGSIQNEKRETQYEPDIELSMASPEPKAVAGVSSDGLPPVPEGGLQAWLTVAGAFLVLFCTFGMISAFGVFQDYYTRVTLTDKTPSDVSWIGSLQLCLLFMLGVPAGMLFDLGYFKSLQALGTLLLVFSIFMTSLTKPHHYYQTFLAQGVGQGIGMGLIYLPALSIASHYFRRRRSFAYGVVVSGTAFGGVIWPLIFNHLFIDRVGFAWGVRVSAFMVLILLTIGNFLMKPRLPNRKNNPNYEKPDLKGVVTDVPYLIVTAGSCFIFWGLLFPFFYLQLFAVVHGVDENIALNLTSIINAGAVVGRLAPGFAADYLGACNVSITFSTISSALIFAMFGATTNRSIIVFAVLYGFFSGAFISLIASIGAAFARQVNEVGIRIGLACFMISFFNLTGQPISGALIGSLDPADAAELKWWKAIVFNGIVILIGCALLTIGRNSLARRKGTPYV